MLFILEEGKYATAGRVKASTSWTQGMWGYLTSEDTTDYDPRWTPVNSYATAQYVKGILAPIIAVPFQKDLGDDERETIYAEDSTSWDGKYPSFVRESGVLLEDTKLADRVLADFTTATPGTKMVLTISGYPTLDGASDDQGGSSTVVGYFEEYTGGSVLYRTA